MICETCSGLNNSLPLPKASYFYKRLFLCGFGACIFSVSYLVKSAMMRLVYHGSRAHFLKKSYKLAVYNQFICKNNDLCQMLRKICVIMS